MLQSFIIVLREGFESFLIVAITAAYLRKTGRANLLGGVTWGVVASVATSFLAGWLLLLGANEPLWEGVLGLISAVLVTWFVVHMWQTAPTLKTDMERELAQRTQDRPAKAALFGVFLFTAFMITREGMETALLLLQVHTGDVWMGAFLGTLAAGAMALAWLKVGRLINLKLFFQVTALFLLLFVAQILIYSFHEFSEAGLLPNSEFLHQATEPFGPDGMYGKWISLATVVICAGWMAVAWIRDKMGGRPAAR